MDDTLREWATTTLEAAEATLRRLDGTDGQHAGAPMMPVLTAMWVVRELAPVLRGAPDGTHCPTCICGKRAPVQVSLAHQRGHGTIAWDEHLYAWSAYSSRFGSAQSAERIAERGGFGYGELVDLLGHDPETWEPR